MNILVADDEINIRETILRVLELEKIRGKGAENGLAARRKLQEESFDLLICDLMMPGMSGQELLEWIEQEGLNITVIMISAYGQAEDAVNALKRGACDYIVKPFDPDELLHRIDRAWKSHVMRNRLKGNEEETSFIANAPSMKILKRKILKIAPSPSTVLITGESGAGKEVTARYIHHHSAVSEGPFVTVNIGGVPENLLESELFGYEKGAFTGADSRKTGLFETAGGGTLFLDEIGEMPLSLQVKLLRVLQENTIRRLGGTAVIPIRARLIAATNRNLEEEIRSGSFREDLYYRLNVARIHLPPLRERREDLLPLSALLLQKLNRKMNRSIGGMTPDAIQIMENYRFPGNIRELENILERACIFADRNILKSEDLDLPSESRAPSFRSYDGKTIREMEKKMIINALRKWEGNRTKAAGELGISRRTIQNKIQEYGLTERKE